jgi:hypothetical protein
MLPENTKEDIMFLGGKDYLPLFCSLTDTIQSRKIVFFNSMSAPRLNGCTFIRFKTTTRTNWHYECANAIIDGRFANDGRTGETQRFCDGLDGRTLDR